jgi:hypothetical protein
MRCLSSSIDLGDYCRILMCLRLIDGVHYGMCSLVFLVLCSYDNIMFLFTISHHYLFSICRRIPGGLPSLWNSPAPWGPHDSLQNSKVCFDLLLILTDLHHTLRIISNLPILPFPFYFAGITSSESWYVVLSKRLICNLVWISLLSFTVDSYNVRKMAPCLVNFLDVLNIFKGFNMILDGRFKVNGGFE